LGIREHDRALRNFIYDSVVDQRLVNE
jgi:hypothetical protein